MKNLYIFIIVFFSFHTAFSQFGSYSWVYEINEPDSVDRIQFISFQGPNIWIAKTDYLMVLDTVTGNSQIAADSLISYDASIYSGSIFRSVLCDSNGIVYAN